ncbi:MAG: hypothetical protein ACXVA9_01065 [Bdellovibrionales bacterium]
MKVSRQILKIFCLLACVYFFAEFSEAYYHVVFYEFQARDLQRALALLAGQPIFFGPEMTGGGNLPGSLYYYLLALPLSFSPAWFSAWYFLITTYVAAGLLGFEFFRRNFSWPLGVLWLGFFLMAPTTHRFEALFLNVSYMLPWTITALILICLAFGSAVEKTREHSFLAACFVLGCALQFHFSNISLFLSILTLQLCARRLKLPQVSRKCFLSGIALFALPSLPFFIWWISKSLGYPFGQATSYSGVPDFGTSSLAVLFTVLPSSLAAMKTSEFWSEGFSHVITTAPYPMLILGILSALHWAGERSKSCENSFRKPILICAIYSFFPFFYWFFAPLGSRYGQAFYVSLLFLSLMDLHALLSNRRRLVIYNSAAAVLLVGCILFTIKSHPEIVTKVGFPFLAVILLSAAIAFNLRSEHRWGLAGALCFTLSLALSFVQGHLGSESTAAAATRRLPALGHWLKIWGPVIQRTGWDWETAIHHTYFINHHMEQFPRPGFEAALAANPRQPSRDDLDGVIVSLQNSPADFEQPGDPTQWLLKQDIQSDIKEAIRHGDLAFEPSLNPKILILPFKVRRESILPRTFHNYGEAYARDSEELILDKIPSTEAAERIAFDRVAFKWNECPDGAPFCSSGILVKYSQTESGKLDLAVRVVGQAISQVSPWICPNWTQAWIEPYVEVLCGGETHKFKLISSLGFRREYAIDSSLVLLLGNNSIVAPFERDYQIACKGKLSAISAGRESSQVESLYNSKKLPGKRLTINL